MASKHLKTSTSTKTTGERDSRKKKRFTFTVKNHLRIPFFNNTDIMEIEDENSPLIRYMEKAINERNGLMDKFTVSYYLNQGYLIQAINDAKGTYLVDRSYWQIRTKLGRANLGISFFIPEDGMEVVLDLVAGSCGVNIVPSKSFTFSLDDQLRDLSYTHTVILGIEDENRPLIRYMEKAVDDKTGTVRKFTVTYDMDCEYKIEAVNDKKATVSVRINFGPAKTVPGISSFIPKDGMNVHLEPN